MTPNHDPAQPQPPEPRETVSDTASETETVFSASPAAFNLRSTPLLVIAVIMTLTALRIASAVFVPLVLGILVSYALSPLVDLLVRLHIPRMLAAAILMLGIVGGIGAVAYSLGDETVALIETLPEVAKKARIAFASQSGQGPAGAIDKVQEVANELERAAEQSTSTPEPDRDVAKVQIEEPKFNVTSYLWPGAIGLAAAAGNLAVVFFITFFLLSAGNNFRRKMVKLAGPTLSQKKLTLQALDEIDGQIQRYLHVQLFTSTLVGMATWLSFLWIGVEHAPVWGVVTFVFNFIPYVGNLIASGAAMVFGFAQFGSFEMAFLIGGSALLINFTEGYLLTPWLTSRASRMNPVAVFAGVLAWGWLWGVWGLFLGVPILMVIKVVCDRVEDFKGVGELLGE